MTTFIGTLNDYSSMISESANTYGGTSTTFSVGERNDQAGYTRRAVLKNTELSGIPSSANINSATLQIVVGNDLSDNARTISAYRVKQAWSGSVSWNKYDASNNWGTAGCGDTVNDRDSTAIGTAPIAASPAVGSVISITLTPNLIQEWVSGVMTNNGILLQVTTESNDCIQYYSNGNGTSSNWPKWIIDYTDSSGGYTLILNT